MPKIDAYQCEYCGGIYLNEQQEKECMELHTPQKLSHKDKHIFLHRQLDILIADFIIHTGKLPSRTKLSELIEWSCDQSINPTED